MPTKQQIADMDVHPRDTDHQDPGLTYREWLLGLALQGVLSGPLCKDDAEINVRQTRSHVSSLIDLLASETNN